MAIRRPILVLPLAAALLAACEGQDKLLVSMNQLQLAVGDSARVQWAVIREHGGNLNPSTFRYDSHRHPERFRLQSSAPAVATVDERGMVRAVGPGTATLTGTSGTLAAPPLPVTVIPRP